MAIVCLISGLLFVVSAVLQWNDPDPWGWLAIYLAAAAVSFWAWRRPVPRAVPFVVAAGALVWAAVLAPAALADFRVSDLARAMKAESPAIELSRELLGLLVVVGWCVVLGVTRVERGGVTNKTAREDPGRS